ncbi:MAG: amino acid permease, partial [Terrimesophilobacter sp.]
FGLRFSGGAQLALTGLLLTVVVGVVAVAIPAGRAENFTPFMPHGWMGVGIAISLFVWAFAGWEAVTHLAGEFKNPSRTIPLATAIAIVVVGVAYLALQVVTVSVLGPAAGKGPVPLLDLVDTVVPGIGPAVVAVAAGVVSMGVLNTYLGAFAKLGASLGRDGDLPRWMAAGAHSGGIARRALAVTGVIITLYFIALILADLQLAPFVLIHTSCMVAIYALGMLAAVRLLVRWSLGWWMAVISCVLVAGLVVLAGANLLAPAALAIAALIVTAVKHFRPLA